MTEADTKHNTHAVQQEAGAKTPASCISGTVIIPHKGGFMSKATAFTLGFVTGAAALGAAAYLAKGWTSEEDEDEDEDEVTQPINDTGSRENGIDDSATSPDLESAQKAKLPTLPRQNLPRQHMPRHRQTLRTRNPTHPRNLR